MIRYKIDILEALKNRGYTTTKIRSEKLLSEATLTSIRNNKPITITTLDTICGILKKQPGALLEWVPDNENPPQ